MAGAGFLGCSGIRKNVIHRETHLLTDRETSSRGPTYCLTERTLRADQYYHLKGEKTFQSLPLKNVISCYLDVDIEYASYLIF